jgi:DNA uptake protein ComE-like DNA-binding protein
MWKDFFYFSKNERKGIIILLVLVVGIFIGKYLFSSDSNAEIARQDTGADTTHYVSAAQPENQTPVETARPVRATHSTNQNQQTETRTYYSQSAKTTASAYPKQEKFEIGTIIELNAADTIALKKIPGIGSSFARRIVGYRSLLGGYYSMMQLQEVYGMYEELYARITPFLRIDTTLITPLKVNSTSLETLRNHPYSNFYRAKAIIEMRKKRGKLENFDQLGLLEEFADDEAQKLRHYLSFE